MFERVLRVLIFVLYVFDTVLGGREEHNNGKDMPKKIAQGERAPAIALAVPS